MTSYYLTPDKDDFPLTNWFHGVRCCLEKNSIDPEAADLIVVGFDTAKERNWPDYGKLEDCYIRGCEFDYGKAVAAVKSVQKDFPGRRVLLFNMSLSQMGYGQELRSGINSPVTVVGLFNKANITGEDISFPPDCFVTYSREERANRNRSLLLSFQGRRSGKLRSEMLPLSEIADVWYCLGPKSDEVGVGKSNGYMDNYKRLNADSVFGLVVRGDMFWAYRLLEVMGAGAIPVILSDDWELPFSNILDWREFSISYPESEWQRAPADLRRMSSGEIDGLHKRLVEVYERHFETLQLRLDTVIESVGAMPPLS